jgi:hypothetical protein
MWLAFLLSAALRHAQEPGYFCHYGALFLGQRAKNSTQKKVQYLAAAG